MAWHKSKNILPLILFVGIYIKQCKNYFLNICRRQLGLDTNQTLSPMQTDATMLANNSQHCWMLHVTQTQQCWPTTLNIVGCYMLCPFAHCCMLLRKVWNRSNFWANNSQHFFYSVIAEAQQCWVPVRSSSNIAHYTWSTWRLQGLMGCILPTMHCMSQHCRKLSHPFAHHCQHGRNNSQHC